MASRAHWSGRLTFVLAAAGSAIGLGNIWKFPYIAGTNGGGAFVLLYLFIIAAIGIPIFIAELYIGQTSQKNAVEAFEKLHKKDTFWRLPGWLGVLSAFLILSFYSVVGGWVLDYAFKSLTNQFAGHSDDQIKGFLGSLFSDPVQQVFWHLLFMSATVAIVAGGIKNGIERWAKILMPTLMVLLGILFFRSMFLPGFGEAMSFLFSPDTSKLTSEGILEAVGHSFFTLSLGMGCMITYGSYLSKKEDLVKTALWVGIMDTGIALVAGVVIFSVVFTNNLEPGAGPTLMFQTLPMLFSKMTGAYFISLAFFSLVAFAALTSAISLLEVIVTYWVEKHKADRKKTTIATGIVTFFLGILSALSTNTLSEYKIAGLTFFDLFDKLTSSVFMPLGGLIISLFYGWILGPKAVRATVGKGKERELFVKGLLWTSRIAAPAAVLVVLGQKIVTW